MLLDQLITGVVTVVGIALSLAYYPQAWRIVQKKSAHEISILSYCLFALGTSTWLFYGFYKHDSTVIAGFLFGVIGSWLVLILALYYRHKAGS